MYRILAGLLLLLLPIEVLACSCAPQIPAHYGQIKESVEISSAVLIAKAVKVKNIGRKETKYVKAGGEPFTEVSYNIQETIFEAVRSWKGNHGAEFQTRISIKCCICGYIFEENKEYLLYLDGPDEDGNYSTFICSRTKVMSESLNGEIELLDKIHLTKK